MRIKCFLYWCLLVIHICKCDNEVSKVEDRSGEAPRRHQWQSSGGAGSPRNTYSLLSDAALHDSSGLTCGEDFGCLEESVPESDRQGLEAIQLLHRQLDDDANGNVDLTESDDFLREELQYDSGYERRQQAFHHNDDMHISARELWEAWLRSEVHNWTVEQTTEWLEKSVELPQYTKTFIDHHVTGATLPRMAVHNMQYLSGVLGIKDPIHKQKITLKAMDVVLFGPPKDGGHRWKDGVLVVLMLGVLVGCWWAYQQGRSSRRQMHRMLKDMESLRQAELDLDHLQVELQRAKKEQDNIAYEKRNLEKRLLEAGSTAMSLTTSYSDLEVSQLKTEIEVLRTELQRAEGELEDRCWSPPAGLQMWLQLTHELENKAYLRKKNNADQQLQQAREACEKLRKKRSSLVGAFVSTHGKSIDDVDRSIVEARTALNEVTQELQERVYRWKQMEMLCGFNIINNGGLPYLENTLYRNNNGRTNRLRISSSQDDLEMEESASQLGTTMGVGGSSVGWREDSSGSEDLESPAEPKHYPMDLVLAEARAQMEERQLMEERKEHELRMQYLDRIKQYRNHLREARSQPSQLERSGALDDAAAKGAPKPREAIQFTLGGDNVNWTGEDIPSAGLRSQSRSQPQLSRSAMNSARAVQPRAPQPPPRKNVPQAGPIVRSQSSEAGLDGCVDELVQLRTNINNNSNNRLVGLTRQQTVASEDGTGSSSSEQSLPPGFVEFGTGTPGSASSINHTALADITEPRPRRRKIHFPFAKKVPKVAGVNQS